MDPIPEARRRSPWTDPRALGASLAFHLLFLAIASLMALGISLPRGPEPPAVLGAEIGPVDNRAPQVLGGGSPGEFGGVGAIELARIAADHPRSPGDRPRDGSAEALLAGVLPGSDTPPPFEAMPGGPATSGFGLLPGEGLGGGGGSGGGTGGAIGPGVGPGTEFFGTPERASSFAFVIDCSGSMSHLFALKIAKAELLISLDRLPPDARFGVVFYNQEPTVFADRDGRSALQAATIESKDRVRDRMSSIRPEGGTNHARALLAAVAMKPEVIYFLTDAEHMAEDDVEVVREAAGPIRIQAIEFGDGPATGAATPLRTLATSTGGTFRHVDLSTIQRPSP